MILQSNLTKLGLLLSTLLSFNLCFADVVDDAAEDDLTKLCAGKAANLLSNIAKQKKYTDDERSRALAHMVEISRECNDAGSNRLKQFHQKLVAASHSMLSLSNVKARRTGIEGLQYVTLQPVEDQPPEGTVTRGGALADTALNDSDVKIRVWALEALVTLQSDKLKVQTTLETSAASDPDPLVREMATDMHSELFVEDI